jgi:hypothetical protein
MFLSQKYKLKQLGVGGASTAQIPKIPSMVPFVLYIFSLDPPSPLIKGGILRENFIPSGWGSQKCSFPNKIEMV